MSVQQDPRHEYNLRILRWFGALFSLVLISVGVIALVSQYVPERSTTLGMAHALYGTDARTYGVTLILFGLFPLAFFAKSPRVAAWWSTITVSLAMLNLLFSLYF